MDDQEPRPGPALAATCPLCGHESARVLPFRYEFRGRPLQGVGCPKGGLARLFPMPSDEEIASLYSEEYLTACTVAVPSTLNLLSARIGMAVYRLRGRSKILRLPPYHLFEYTPRSLRAMLEASGFRVDRLRQSAVPLGKMGLRGWVVENDGKAVLRLFARAGAFACNRGGDCLLAVGVRPGDGAGTRSGETNARRNKAGGR